VKRMRIHPATSLADLPRLLARALALVDRVEVPGVGVFFLATRRARNVRCVETRRIIRLPATREVRFRAVKSMRKAVAL